MQIVPFANYFVGGTGWDYVGKKVFLAHIQVLSAERGLYHFCQLKRRRNWESVKSHVSFTSWCFLRQAPHFSLVAVFSALRRRRRQVHARLLLRLGTDQLYSTLAIGSVGFPALGLPACKLSWTLGRLTLKVWVLGDAVNYLVGVKDFNGQELQDCWDTWGTISSPWHGTSAHWE